MLLISALFSFEMWRKNEREKRISLHVCFIGNHLSLTSWVSLCFGFLLLLLNLRVLKCLSHADCSLAQFLGKLYMKLYKHTLSHVSFQPPKWVWSQLIEHQQSSLRTPAISVLRPGVCLRFLATAAELARFWPKLHVIFLPWFLHKYTCCALHHVRNLGSDSLLYN